MTTEQRAQRIRSVVDARQQGVVVLEDIESFFNAAAVYRTCEALGFGTIHLVFENARPFDPKMTGHRAATSAACWLDFVVWDHTADCLAALKADGYTLLATVVADDAEPLREAQIVEPKIALMLGNEKTGLSEAANAAANRRLTIPMAGMMQSTNLSVTAGMFLYEITRQRMTRGWEQYTFSDQDRQRLYDQYTKRRGYEQSNPKRKRRKR